MSPSEYNRRVQQAQQALNREIDRVNRANKKAVDDFNRAEQRRVDEHNRRAQAHNKKVIDDHNRQVAAQKRQVDDYNRRADAHNKKVISDLNRQLRSASSGVRYTESERGLADRVQGAVSVLDPREYDLFLSYARIDGAEVASALRRHLEDLDVAVWFDEVAIKPGHSQSLQMDAGLRKARAGVALLTPAYLAGRFWTQRELGALLGKDTLIPVLHNVTFDDVKQFSGILPDLAGFTTANDSVETIAEKIAAAVLVDAV